MRIASVSAAMAGLAFVASAVAQTDAPRYRAQVIQLPWRLQWWYMGINNHGRIIVTVLIDGVGRRGLLLDANGGPPQLVTSAPGSRGEYLLDINEAGDCAGYTENLNVAYCHDGVVQEVAAGTGGEAFRISDTGLIAGTSSGGRPAVWDPRLGTQTLYSVPSAYGGWGADVNNLGVVVGMVDISNPPLAPAVWSGGQRTLLPTFGGDWSEAVRVNDAGQVLVMTTDSARTMRTYRWTAGLVEEIRDGDQVGSDGWDMNQRGDCVGGRASGRAYLFKDGVTYDVNDLVVNTVPSLWKIQTATAINDVGQILAVGRDTDVNEVLLLLNPLHCGSADFNGDGVAGTDADIEAFFACVAGNCCPTCGSADFDDDGDVGTDADIEAFFRVLSGGTC